MTDVVSLDAVTREFGSGTQRITPVRALSLAVSPGEILGIAGPSGCGKSTLLRLAAGLERPDLGTVRYGEMPAWNGRRRHPSYPRPGYVMPVFQDPSASLDARWPIWKTLTEPVHRLYSSRSERRSIADRWLAEARLEHVDRDARPCQLSGGQCQRIAVLRALIAEPALIVADEPTARQDIITAAALSAMLRSAADNGTAIMIVSHNRVWLESLTPRIVDLSRC